jgi:hypothetical protein
VTISVEELAALIREIEVEDPIDYGDLPYDEDDLRRLVCNQIHEISDRAGELGEENRTTVLLAVAAKLVLENLVLNVRLMQQQGLALDGSAEDLFRRLRGGQG